MAHRYGDPVSVTVARGELTSPTSFTWRGRRYWVSVIGMWRLCSYWWNAEPASRTYYRVMTAECQVFELYRTDVTGVWVLDVCHD